MLLFPSLTVSFLTTLRSVIPNLCTTQFVGADPEFSQPLIDWGFVTSPQAGAAGRGLLYARGKTLGGSSARNYMAYHRGTTGSYERWAQEVDDESYTFENLLPFFQQSVTLTPPAQDVRFPNSSVAYDPDAFNNSIRQIQPLSVTWSNYASPLASWVQKGLAQVGILPSEQNFQSGNLSGSAWTPSTITADKQHRSSSQTSFLSYAMDDTSLLVYPQTLTRRILFNDNKEATGVLVQSGDKNYTLTANKEVILSSGAFQSPQLLMVSGIGPEETLERYDIPLLSALPGVGQNMWDQPFYGISYRVNVLTASESINNPLYAADAVEIYLKNATGPLSAPPGFIAFERLSSSRPDLLFNSTIDALKASFPEDWPEVEYLAIDAYTGYNRDYRTADPMDGYQYATLSAAIISPFSRGNLTIASADAQVPPIINPNWLTAPEDIDLAIASFKRIREIWSHLSGVTIGAEYLPGVEVDTDEKILDFIQQSVIQLYHASATCKMGKSNDSMAVIDSKARVYGVSGLRVVDASSFPFLTPGHPQSGVYMLAEKIAHDILSGS